MNEEGNKKSADYEEEKARLKKKLTIFIVISIAFTILFQLTMSDVGFLTNLASGALFGIVFYIPGRIRDYLHLGWFMTIVIAVVFLFILLFLASKIGPIAYIVLLLPLADMGYSIYKIVSAKKDS